MADKADKPVDVDRLLEELKSELEETNAIVEQIGAEVTGARVSTERLIDDVAENLASMRLAAGLPPKDSDYFKSSISRRQRESTDSK